MSIFYFIDTSISKHVDIFFDIGFRLRTSDKSILHHAFISIFIALWAIITRYVTILMPFLSYFTRFTRRGRMPAAGILDLIKQRQSYLICTSPNELKMVFQAHARVERYELSDKFYSCKMEENSSVSEHILKMSGYYNLDSAGS